MAATPLASTSVVPLVDANLDASALAIISRSSAPLLVPAAQLASLTPALAAQPALTYLVTLAEDANVDVAKAADILDAGAAAVVVSLDAASSLISSQSLPASRIVVSLADASQLKGLAAQGVAGVLLDVGSDLSTDKVSSALEALGSKNNGKPLFVFSSSAASLESVASIAKLGASLVVATSKLSFDGSSSAGLDFIAALLSGMTSDRSDGLFPTTVVSSALRTSLGLVYSSQESIRESLLTGWAVYQSRKRGLWRKGETSGAKQQVVQVKLDCDNDAVEFQIRQQAGKDHVGFCHIENRESCFGALTGLAKLEATLVSRKVDAPAGSYTARIFSDKELLSAKIREEADELVGAKDEDKEHVAFEAADLFYFALARCVRAGVSLEDIERSLDKKALKVSRRKGDAKPAYVNGSASSSSAKPNGVVAAPAASTSQDPNAPILMSSYRLEDITPARRVELLKRPAIKSEATMELVRPILRSVREGGDKALLELTAKFDKAKLDSPIMRPPFVNDEVRSKIKPETITAIEQAYKNIYKFHAAQKKVGGNKAAGGEAGPGQDEDDAVLEVETMPGVVCRRFARPIQSVGLYVPGGSAVLPSTALMLGIPAQVAKCQNVVIATPPRPDGSIAPEVLYVADLVKASCILKAGGAQAVGAMAYGTESVPKVDKILGPGNQFVTAAKMLVQNDTDALVSIDMPAGPSEVLVIADGEADPEFVASDLLSQAEHGPDSQVVLVGIALSEAQLKNIEQALDRQAKALPRCDVVRKAIEKSVTVIVPSREDAIKWSNDYAPEHLIIQTTEPDVLAKDVINAGSIFVGQWSPESCGDYASGTNHSLPTYGLARQYSGVSVSSFEKHITSQQLTAEGLKVLGPHVVALAKAETLDAHARAVEIRLKSLTKA